MQSITRTLLWSLLLNMLTIDTALSKAPVAASNPVTESVTAEAVNGVIVLYHHVSTQTPRSTSVSPEEFAQHLAYIEQHFNVVPLTQLVSALQGNGELPQRAIAITFDDGYANILHNAHPLLQGYGFPYSIFINPARIGKSKQQLTWPQIRTMQQQGVTFANHTLDHLHLLNRHTQETEEQWLNRVWLNIETAEQAIAEHTGTSLKYLAYPFGEYNRALAQKAADNDYVAFAQHSGAVGRHTPITAIPRFPAAGPYAKLSTLKTKLASLAMPVVASSLVDPELPSSTLSEPVSITLHHDAAKYLNVAQLNCYFQGEPIAVTATDDGFQFNLDDPLPVGRSRVNCTAPAKQAQGRYYWYSTPFFVAGADGLYPN